MSYKSKVLGGVKPDPWAKRLWHNFWLYRVGQFTTGNLKKMAEASTNSGGVQPVVSDIQPYVIHTFKEELEAGVVMVVRQNSHHVHNIEELKRGSVMVGHTDPQIFHWFKQLGSVPPRGLMSGDIRKLTGQQFDDVWWNSVVKHPIIHDQAKKMWEDDEGVGEAERAAMKKKEEQRDMQRMAKMTGTDWRAKHELRERSPTPEDDAEAPLYIMKAEDFALYRVVPDTLYYADATGAMNKVRSRFPTDRDPLVRVVPRFIRLANLNRPKTMASLNINYNMKFSNCFAYSADKHGMYFMATQEDVNSGGKEIWNEYFLEYGKGMEITTETDLEWWFRNMTRLGQAETGTMSNEMEEADPADVNFKTGQQ